MIRTDSDVTGETTPAAKRQGGMSTYEIKYESLYTLHFNGTPIARCAWAHQAMAIRDAHKDVLARYGTLYAERPDLMRDRLVEKLRELRLNEPDRYSDGMENDLLDGVFQSTDTIDHEAEARTAARRSRDMMV